MILLIMRMICMVSSFLLNMSKKFILGFSFMLGTLCVIGQSADTIDNIVYKIYNLQFDKVPIQINELKKTDPEIAGYLELDYLWWKMISDGTVSSESNFVMAKNGFLTGQNKKNRDFKTLMYYMYQIRYENIKKSSLSKYFSALKCQLYIQKLDESKSDALNPLEQDLLQLVVEFDKCLKYKLINDLDILKIGTNQNIVAGLEKIENLQNKNCRSFVTIKDYFLGKIYLEIVHDSAKAFDKFAKLSENFPSNLVFKEIKQKCKPAASGFNL